MGRLEVRPASREVIAGELRKVLQPRVMQVLISLARADGEVVTRDQLIESCWGGQIVGEDAITRVVCRLRDLAKELSARELTPETIKKVGYRLPRAGPAGDAARAGLSGESADKASLAVWPFENLADDPDQHYFVNGMAEEITTALSRYPSLLVIGAGSSRTFQAAGLDPRAGAERLGVRYMLEGSVRRAAGRVRISVRLVDAEAGATMWADRFEDTLDDVFALQDRVALAVAGVIEPRLLVAEMRRAARRPTANLGSYDLYLRAVPLVQTFVVEEQRRALELLHRAIELDGGFGRALGAAAFAHSQLYQRGVPDAMLEHRRWGLEFASRALQAGGTEPEVLSWIADASVQMGQDLDTAIRLIDRARMLNQGFAYAWFVSGILRIMAGDSEDGVAHVETAQRLDPMSWIQSNMLNWLAIARFNQGRLDEATSLLLEARQLKSSYPTTLPMLAACYAHAGRLDKAAEAMSQIRFGPAKATAWAEHLFRKAEHRALFLDGVTRARDSSRSG